MSGTVNVRPRPIVDRRVRMHTTGEMGRARRVRFDNKGCGDKRFYWETWEANLNTIGNDCVATVTEITRPAERRARQDP